MQLLEYPGRPALSTLDNNTPNPKPGLLEYIPAVQTRPFSITSASSTESSNSADMTAGKFDGSNVSTGANSSSGGSNNGTRIGLSACWEEELCVDAAPDQLVESDALLLLELLQLPGGFARYKVSLPDTSSTMLATNAPALQHSEGAVAFASCAAQGDRAACMQQLTCKHQKPRGLCVCHVVVLQRHAYDFGKAGAGHSIAWGFLRLSGLQHKQLMQGQPLKLKLQLYQYSPGECNATLLCAGMQ